MKDLNIIGEVTLSYKTNTRPSDRKKVKSAEDAYNILKPLFDPIIEHREQFAVLLLNRSNDVLGWFCASQGGVAGTVADPKIIMQAALLSNASGMILAHNHPSGNMNPSESDKTLTKRIGVAAKALDIGLLDHLIITTEGYFSFADKGLL